MGLVGNAYSALTEWCDVWRFSLPLALANFQSPEHDR